MAVSVTQVVTVVGVPEMVVLKVCVCVRYSVEVTGLVSTEVMVLAGIVSVEVSSMVCRLTLVRVTSISTVLRTVVV